MLEKMAVTFTGVESLFLCQLRDWKINDLSSYLVYQMRLINYGLRFAYIRRSARTLCRAHRQVAQHAQVDGRRLGFYARYNHRYAGNR